MKRWMLAVRTAAASIAVKITMLAMLALAGSVAIASAADVNAPRQVTYQGTYQAKSLHDWSGLYLGVHGGALMSSSSMSTEIPGFVQLYDSASTAGFVGGGQFGYLSQSGRFVYGFELSGSLTSVDLKSTDAFGVTKELKHPWEIAAVGRLGYALDSTLLSIYGGPVRGKFSVSEDAFGFGSESASVSRWAPRVGARVDFALSQNWSAGLSVDYTKWGNFDHTNDSLGIVSGYNLNEVRTMAQVNVQY